MRNQGRILSILALIAAISAFGAVYQFYFKEKLAEYAKDEILRNDLQTAYNDLKDKFGGGHPEELTRLWVGALPAWEASRDQRSKFYNFSDWFEHNAPPEDIGLLRYWYEEEVTEVLEGLYKEFQQAAPTLQMYPNWYDIRGMLNAPPINSQQTSTMTVKEVRNKLGELSFGISVCRLLMENNVSRIDALKVWPFRTIKEHNQLLNLKTVGVNISISARDLVNLLDTEMRMADRYITVDAIRIQYPYIAYDTEPQLKVQLLFTQAKYRKQFEGTGGGITAGAGGGAALQAGAGANADLLQTFLNRGRSRNAEADEPVEEPGAFAKGWRWFKRNVLYMSGMTLYIDQQGGNADAR